MLLILTLISCDNSPKLSIDTKNIILGNIKLGEDKKILINITNKGGLPLKIDNVSSSCKCLIIDFPQSPIGIDETKSISLLYKADELGSHRESISIVSNDPDRHKVISIDAYVVKWRI